MNDPIELQKRIDELEAEKASLEVDLQRVTLWAGNLRLALWDLQSRVNSFVSGAIFPAQQFREPRVLGFKSEFNAMVEACSKRGPELASAEDMKKAMLAENKP